MNDEFEDQEYDDDEYDYDHPSLNPYYYKFDVGPDHPISKWINDIVNDFMGSSENYNMTNIPGFPFQMFPVSSWSPNTGKGNAFQYLGSNYQDAKIWVAKYLVIDKIHQEYINHLKANAAYFLNQPHYYKNMFHILN